MQITWLITDTHLGHDKMVEYCGRPENHSEVILKNISDMVKRGDTLIHLGDFCIGNDAKWHDELSKVTDGVRTILVRGNHDSKSDAWYEDHGWSMVCNSFSRKYFGKNILFTHIPKLKSDFDVNVHGHFHNADHRRTEPELQALYDHSYHKLLAIEYTQLKPVKLEDFLTAR